MFVFFTMYQNVFLCSGDSVEETFTATKLLLLAYFWLKDVGADHVSENQELSAKKPSGVILTNHCRVTTPDKPIINGNNLSPARSAGKHVRANQNRFCGAHDDQTSCEPNQHKLHRVRLHVEQIINMLELFFGSVHDDDAQGTARRLSAEMIFTELVSQRIRKVSDKMIVSSRCLVLFCQDSVPGSGGLYHLTFRDVSHRRREKKGRFLCIWVKRV